MPASATFYSDGIELSQIDLGDVLLSLDEMNGLVGLGEPVEVTMQNTGDTVLRRIAFFVEGDHRESVQFSVDKQEWLDPGAPVDLLDAVVEPGESISVWARGVFRPEDVEGVFDLELQVNALSTGR